LKKLTAIILTLILSLLFLPCSSYSDCVDGDCVNGQGTFTFPDGSKYVGNYKDGKFDGQGTYTHYYGSEYVGQLKEGRKLGQGTYTNYDGKKYVGEFKDDKPNGQGTFTYR